MEKKNIATRLIGNQTFFDTCGKVSGGKIIDVVEHHHNKSRYNLTNKDLVEFYNYIEKNKEDILN